MNKSLYAPRIWLCVVAGLVSVSSVAALPPQDISQFRRGSSAMRPVERPYHKDKWELSSKPKIDFVVSNPLFSFEGLKFDDIPALTGFYSIPAFPHGGVGPSHILSTVVDTIQWATRAGVVQNTQGLGQDDQGSVTGSFFESIPPVSPSLLTRAFYDQHDGRFVVVSLDWTAINNGDPTNQAGFLIAISNTNNPNDGWIFKRINAVVDFNGQPHFPASLEVGIGADEIYITGNIYRFSDLRGPGAWLWVIPKEPMYSGGNSVPTTFDIAVVSGFPSRTIDVVPAQMHGEQAPGVTMYLVNAGWTLDEIDAFILVEIYDPLTAPVFLAFASDLGNIHNDDFEINWTVPQKGTSEGLEVGDVSLNTQAFCQGETLWISNTFRPPTGPDMNQPSVFWISLDTFTGNTIDQGFVGGEELGAGTFTFYGSIAADADGGMAVGFSACGPDVHPGAYYTGRLQTDPATQTDPPRTAAAGTDYYVRTFSGTRNRWGPNSITVLDPSGESYWTFNSYAITRGIPDNENQDGRWATRWVQFGQELVPADFDGDGDVDKDDLFLFVPCAGAPDVPYNPVSLPAGCNFTADPGGFIHPDADRDGDVDQIDFAVFQQCFSGEDVDMNPDCAD